MWDEEGKESFWDSYADDRGLTTVQVRRGIGVCDWGGEDGSAENESGEDCELHCEVDDVFFE